MGDRVAVETLAALGVRGILMQLARDGQLMEVRCEMPRCYCFRGREHFDSAAPQTDWSPTADHYPTLKSRGGRLTRDNVRLAHRLCNRRDYEWRTRINEMLRRRMSLDEIAAALNARKSRRSTAPTGGRPPPYARRSSPREVPHTGFEPVLPP